MVAESETALKILLLSDFLVKNENATDDRLKTSTLWPLFCVLSEFNRFLVQRYCLLVNRSLYAILEGVIILD